MKTSVRPSSRQTTANSGAPGTASSISSISSFNRLQAEPISDITNDTSHLTVGPTLQGNPLKALMARRKTNKSDKEDSIETDIDEPSTLKPMNYKSAMKTLEESKDETNEKYKNKGLHDEIAEWKKEHMK